MASSDSSAPSLSVPSLPSPVCFQNTSKSDLNNSHVISELAEQMKICTSWISLQNLKLKFIGFIKEQRVAKQVLTHTVKELKKLNTCTWEDEMSMW